LTAQVTGDRDGEGAVLTQLLSTSGSLGQRVTLSCTGSSSNIGSGNTVNWSQQLPGKAPRTIIDGNSNRPSGVPDQFSGSKSGSSGTLTITGLQDSLDGPTVLQARGQGRPKPAVPQPGTPWAEPSSVRSAAAFVSLAKDRLRPAPVNCVPSWSPFTVWSAQASVTRAALRGLPEIPLVPSPHHCCLSCPQLSSQAEGPDAGPTEVSAVGQRGCHLHEGPSLSPRMKRGRTDQGLLCFSCGAAEGSPRDSLHLGRVPSLLTLLAHTELQVLGTLDKRPPCLTGGRFPSCCLFRLSLLHLFPLLLTPWAQALPPAEPDGVSSTLLCPHVTHYSPRGNVSGKLYVPLLLICVSFFFFFFFCLF
uniref:Immunoglobulin V-set domain-containing protein n=1 Tax=Sus scrofa TaxID=9823 RepID=A0A8D0Y7X0_PIG